MSKVDLPLSIPRRPGVFGALKSRDFRLLWYSGLLRSHARWMEPVVLGWVVLEMTDSPWLVGLVGFFRMIAMPALGLVAGTLADRMDRKRVMVAAQAVNVVAVAALSLLFLLDVVRFWHIGLVALAMGITWAVEFPARSVLISQLVQPRGIANAMSLDTAAMMGSKMMGPISGGLLLALTGAQGAILALVALYGVGFVLLWRVGSPVSGAVGSRQPVLRRRLAEGLACVVSSKLLLAVVMVTIVANLLVFPYVLMVPVFARNVLGVGPTLMGILAAGDGLGSMVGSVYLASRADAWGPGRVFVYGTIVATIFVLGFALSPVYGLSLVLLLLAGLALAGFNTMQRTIMLLGAPEEMRGRVLGVLMTAIGTGPLGFLITGAAAEAWGAPVAVALECALALALMAGILAWIPSIRKRQPFASQGRDAASEAAAPARGTPDGA